MDYPADDYEAERAAFPDSGALVRIVAECLLIGLAVIGTVVVARLFYDRWVNGPSESITTLW